jgi:hypothetical protein
MMKNQDFPVSVAAQELDLDGNREILVLRHALGGLAVYHDPIVSKGPTRTSGYLFSHKPVFEPETIVREFLFIEDMAEFSVELVVLVIANLQKAVFHTERFAVIVIQGITRDLRFPAVKVLAVEKTDPPALSRLILLTRIATKPNHQNKT